MYPILFKKLLKSSSLLYSILSPLIKYIRKTKEKLFCYLFSKKDLKEFKNLYKDQRCFIVGNGPSLTSEDLEKLKDEITFAANKIYNIFEQTEWRPTYYLVQDPTTLVNIRDRVQEVGTKKKFVSISAKLAASFDCDDCVYFYLNKDNYPYKKPFFSEDISKEIFEGYTVTYSSIQMAAFMGFKEIYLLGVDFNYSMTKNLNGEIIKNEGVNNYFGGSKKETEPDSMPNLEYNMLAFKAAKSYADNKGIKIYNATRGGKLEVFERVNLDEIL